MPVDDNTQADLANCRLNHHQQMMTALYGLEVTVIGGVFLFRHQLQPTSTTAPAIGTHFPAYLVLCIWCVLFWASWMCLYHCAGSVLSALVLSKVIGPCASPHGFRVDKRRIYQYIPSHSFPVFVFLASPLVFYAIGWISGITTAIQLVLGVVLTLLMACALWAWMLRPVWRDTFGNPRHTRILLTLRAPWAWMARTVRRHMFGGPRHTRRLPACSTLKEHEMSYFDQGSFQMYYQISSGLVAEDVLLIHGNVASNRWWYRCREEWFRRQSASSRPVDGGDLLMAEWRGCGRSGPLLSLADIDFMQFGAHYLDLLDHLGKDRVHVIAHSTGALIAMCAMVQRPEQFGRVVFLDPVPPSGLPFDPQRQARFMKMRHDRAYCAEVMQTTIRNVDPHDPLFQDIVDDAADIDVHMWRGFYPALSRINIAPQVANLTHPMLILHGGEDTILSIEGSQSLCEGHEKTRRFVRLEGRGHSLNLEAPGEFVELVNGFLFGE